MTTMTETAPPPATMPVPVPLVDCAALWAALSPAAQAQVGAAAVLFALAGLGQADALDAGDLRLSRFCDIADGAAIDALTQRLDAAGLTRFAGLPDLRPFGVQQCRRCGCIDETPCDDRDGGACYWAEPDLCSCCVPAADCPRAA